MISMNRPKSQTVVHESVEEFLRRGGRIEQIPIGHSSERIQYRAKAGTSHVTRYIDDSKR